MLLKKQLLWKGHSDPLFIPLKAGNRPPTWKAPCLYQKEKRHPYHQRCGAQGWKGCINKPCYFTNLLPNPKPLCLVNSSRIYCFCLKGMKAACLGHFFESLFIFYWFPCTYKIKFVFLLLICLACVCAKSLQSCPALCNPMDCSPPGSSVHRILQARILE